ncbi:MAG: insulinase family protein [Clostridia bacterium]|nr:insulinase family protein [Clostridia bacterium]
MTRPVEVFESTLLGEQYVRYLHKSGLPVFVFPKKMTATYALFATELGAVDNAPPTGGMPPLPDGTAHFLEHKLFTNEDGSDAFEDFSAIGADANAYTSHTRTVYLFSATEQPLAALDLLVRFVTNPYFTAETVAKEQGIIGEEIRMCRDNPYDRCYYNMLCGLYERHPVRVDIAGSEASIARITPEVLYAAHAAYYRPDNMTLVVCGDVTPEAVFAVVDKALADWVLPKVQAPARTHVAEAPRAYLSRTEETGQVAKPIFSIGVKDTAIPAEPAARLVRDAAMAILNEVLFGASGELYNRLFDEGLISPEFSANYALARDFAFNQIAGEADDPDAVLARVLAYLKEVKEKGISDADFDRALHVEYAEYIKSFDSTEEIANTLLSFVTEGADYFSYADVLQTVTRPMVEALLAEVFDPAHITLSVIVPRKE